MTALTRLIATLTAAIAGSGAPTAGATEPDLELGEYLAAECTTCHREDAVVQGIPAIYGIPVGVFMKAMEQYRDGSRTNKVMRNVARSLSDEEIAALAAYLEQASQYK